MVSVPIFYILSFFFIQFNTERSWVPTPSAKKDSAFQYIYLSFDDGPLPGTRNCINVCLNENVAATFFQVGLHQSRSKYGQNLYRTVASNRQLFDLCNHSFSHAYGKYVDFYNHPDAALTDFVHAKNILQPNNNITRLPGNNAWNIASTKRASGLVKPLVKKLDSAGFNVIGWDLQWHFNRFGKPVQSPQKMALMVDSLLRHQKTKTKNHLVILMHDPMFRASNDSIQLTQFITLLKANPTYKFGKLTQYPGLKN